MLVLYREVSALNRGSVMASLPLGSTESESPWCLAAYHYVGLREHDGHHSQPMQLSVTTVRDQSRTDPSSADRSQDSWQNPGGSPGSTPTGLSNNRFVYYSDHSRSMVPAGSRPPPSHKDRAESSSDIGMAETVRSTRNPASIVRFRPKNTARYSNLRVGKSAGL